ncbi:hypothetical protein AJ80_08005 [Polytolypa hystricis UAMH7299]|uniref:Non-homologous end-joining factor 1 n=1 Tax=Polytolypa hystricis (strain UAMH7299) TaxID=1447883 RepID=A0A2B7X6T5_POLH7|nr:hypothetical protein AJ80_08005 [Polytolypa hystricis UAMH7299]
MPRDWKRLPLSGNGTPPLLYKYSTTSAGYEIFITDLAYIWTEKLSHSRILDRASDEDTSIDPSEDDEQFAVLLGKLKDALQGADGSRVFFTKDSKGSDLKLRTSTKLPAPLYPLKWTFQLSRSPQNALTKQILLPVLRGEANHEARLNSLIEHLKEKDSVLGRLFDKIESSGVDLSTVFPGMAGVRLSRKGSVLSQASKAIKGVAPFDEAAWNTEFEARSPDSSLGMNIAKELSGPNSPFEEQTDVCPTDGWWSQLSATERASKPPEKKKPRRSPTPEPEETAEETADEDDDFEVRKTPPRQRKKQMPAAQSEASDDEITHEASDRGGKRPDRADDSTRGASSLSQSPPPQKSKRKPKGLGTIGGKPKATQRPSEASSASDPDAQDSPQKPKSKPKKGLGTIGGKKPELRKPSRESPESTASDISTAPENPSKASTPKDTLAETDEDDDEIIPQHGKRKKPAEEDTDSQSPEKKPPPKPRGGLGQIGGKKQQKAPVEPVEKRPSTPPTASEDEDEGEEEYGVTKSIPQRTKQSSQAAALPKPKRIGKLGMIGGSKSPQKQKQTVQRKSPQPPGDDDDDDATTADEAGDTTMDIDTSPEKSRRKPPVGDRASSSPSLPPAVKKAETPPPPRPSAWQKPKKEDPKDETPEERANRKREELRRQLAGNKSAGPAKKKRRF